MDINKIIGSYQEKYAQEDREKNYRDNEISARARSDFFKLMAREDKEDPDGTKFLEALYKDMILQLKTTDEEFELYKKTLLALIIKGGEAKLGRGPYDANKFKKLLS
jgi:hypothetical protein